MSHLGRSMLVFATALWISPVAAQAPAPPSAADSPAARAIVTGRQGVRAYEQGEWAEALARFREAESLYHSPVFVLFAARCQRQLGQLLEARAALARLASEPLAADAPAPWTNAQADARLELAELASEVPTVMLVVEGGSPTTRTLLDDHAAEPERPIELNPGQHRALAEDGSRRREITFNITARSHPTITLSLVPAPATPSKPPPARTTTPPAVPRDQRGPYLPGWILTGTGALALATGGVVGVLALNKRSELRKKLPEGCEHERCLDSRRSAVDQHFQPARDLALASDILWISGAVLATTGVALVVVDPRSKSGSVSVGGRF